MKLMFHLKQKLNKKIFWNISIKTKKMVRNINLLLFPVAHKIYFSGLMLIPTTFLI